MSLHTKPRGREVIAALATLGQTLGYFVRKEYPVREDAETPPAVDVAWFVDATQKYPIMMFEVESGSSNTAPYNAMKVLGTPRDVFEKPLFFFHVILGGSTDSARVKTLESQYGTLNYRVYQEGRAGLTELNRDILSQHRRLHDNVDVCNLVEVLSAEAWRDQVDLSKILLHCELLQLRRTMLSDYAWLALNGHRFARDHYLRLLLAAHDRGNVPDCGDVEYKTYLGNHWPLPLHLGIVALVDPARRNNVLQELRRWQDESSHMSQIGPHFGLSLDYDKFIAGLAPPLLALIAGLMRDVPGGPQYLLAVCRNLLPPNVTPRQDVVVFNALWRLHMAHAAGDEAAFTEAADIVRNANVSVEAVLVPPAYVSWEDPDGIPSGAGDGEGVPSFTSFSAAARAHVALEIEDDPLRVALQALRLENPWSEWSTKIVWLLHRDRISAGS